MQRRPWSTLIRNQVTSLWLTRKHAHTQTPTHILLVSTIKVYLKYTPSLYQNGYLNLAKCP